MAASVDNTRKQNILIVHNYYQNHGGEDTVVANEKKMLEEHGHKVILYSRNNSELKSMLKLQNMMLTILTVFNVRTYSDIKRLIKMEQIDIVHVHNTLSLISPSVYYAAKSMKVPIVQTIHNFRLLCPGATFYRDGHICEDCITKGLMCAVKHSCYRDSKLQTLACVISTKIHRLIGIYGKITYICLTEFNKEKLLQLKQIKTNRVFVKPNFVKSSINEIVPHEERKEQFIYAGRLDKLKGVDILFEAWKQMGKKVPKFIMCGMGTLDEWCRTFIKTNDVNIEMYGFIPNQEIIKIISNSKALILPTQWYEGFPMSIVESFSVGTPVICSDLGNAGSIVKEGITGCKFAADIVKELVLAVHRCKGLYKSTLAEYNAKYTEEINYQMLQRIYNQIVKNEEK